MEKRTNELTATRTKYGEAESAVREAGNFERREKAEMKLKTIDVAAAQKLVASAQQGEKDIKSAIASSNKIKLQKCGVMKIAVEEAHAMGQDSTAMAKLLLVRRMCGERWPLHFYKRCPGGRSSQM